MKQQTEDDPAALALIFFQLPKIHPVNKNNILGPHVVLSGEEFCFRVKRGMGSTRLGHEKGLLSLREALEGELTLLLSLCLTVYLNWQTQGGPEWTPFKSRKQNERNVEVMELQNVRHSLCFIKSQLISIYEF